tara:strand:- start:6864 stop:7526 length:663 start_codon:yes stop_codon:yes gene_type:complete
MNKLQHKEQRVLVLFDVQNMYYSARNMFNAKVNFHEILKKAVSGRKLIRAIAYVIKADMRDENKFHDALQGIGIEVKMKGLQTFITGTKKGDWDIGIAMDAVRLSNKVDTVVLISGDGDFKDLLSYLKSHGCRTEVIAFSKTSSRLIKDEADDFFDLGSDMKKYLLKGDARKPHPRFKKPYKKSTKPAYKQKKLVKSKPRTQSKPKPRAQSLPNLKRKKK